MTIAWGNPEEHTRAFVQALEEFHRDHPEEHRPFQDLEYEKQRVILARQVEIYSQTLQESRA